jgi:septation ring formation regulator EzrA
MATQSNIHFYVNWAKERLDEMEAVLASLEGKMGEVQADARHRADMALTDLRKSRDAFRDTLKKQAEANEAAWTSAKAKLEPEWNSFEAEVKNYVESFSKQIEQQQATFKLQAAAQLKAWQRRQAFCDRASDRNRDRSKAHVGRRRRRGGKASEAA